MFVSELLSLTIFFEFMLYVGSGCSDFDYLLQNHKNGPFPTDDFQGSDLDNQIVDAGSPEGLIEDQLAIEELLLVDSTQNTCILPLPNKKFLYLQIDILHFHSFLSYQIHFVSLNSYIIIWIVRESKTARNLMHTNLCFLQSCTLVVFLFVDSYSVVALGTKLKGKHQRED